jgi:TolB-like protein/thioredoxin-like negative regulator of GroEL
MAKSRKIQATDPRPFADVPFRLGEFQVDPGALRINGPGHSVKIEFKVMQLLLMLAGQPRQVVSRRDLETTVWAGRVVSDDAVTNAIAKLRRAFGDSARSPRFIETVPKSGYRLLLLPEPLVANPTAARSPIPPWLLVGTGILAVTVLVAMLIGRPFKDPAPRSLPAEPRVVESRATVAVVPFENPVDDPSQAAFVAGLTRDLITDLSAQDGLTVLSARATFHLDPDAPDLHQAVRDLGVAYLVRGSLARLNGQLALEVLLIETASGRTLWSNTLRAPDAGVFDIQREVAQTIATVLAGRLSAGFEFTARRGVTHTLGAYEAFLQGLSAYLRVTRDDNETARMHFARATELDPGFARAYGGLALTWAREVMDGWAADPAQALGEAASYIGVAEAIDPDLPQVHFVKGMIALFRGQHLVAAEAVQRATTLDPNYADAYALLAWILHYGGRPDVALDALQEALRLNPLSSAAYEAVAGEINFALGRYADAVDRFQQALDRNPTHARARVGLAVSLAKHDRLEDARWELDELLTVDPGLSVDRLAFGLPYKDPDVRRRFFNALERVRMVSQ